MGRGGGEVVFKKESASFKVPFHNHVAELIIVTTKESYTWTASVDTLGSRERTTRHLQLSLNQSLWFPSAVMSLQLLPQVPRREVGWLYQPSSAQLNLLRPMHAFHVFGREVKLHRDTNM